MVLSVHGGEEGQLATSSLESRRGSGAHNACEVSFVSGREKQQDERRRGASERRLRFASDHDAVAPSKAVKASDAAVWRWSRLHGKIAWQ